GMMQVREPGSSCERGNGMTVSDWTPVLATGVLYAFVIIAVLEKLAATAMLRDSVNLYRWECAGLALSLLALGLGLLTVEKRPRGTAGWQDILSEPFREVVHSPRTLGAWIVIGIAVSFGTLLGWCCLRLPRHPHSFAHASGIQEILDYYIGRLRI